MRLRQSLSPRVARRSIAARAIALSLAVVGTPSLHAQPGATTAPTLEPALRDTLRARIRTLLDSASVASVTVAVARDGVVLWEEGFGFADIARHVRVTPATRYSIASITKPMTATAVMRLVEQVRVDLDEPIDTYLGAMRVTGLAGDRAGATVRRVLSHTAGLPLHYRFFYAGGRETPNVTRTVERYGRVMFPPGEVYSYSNLGYGMLGELVRSVTGIPYERYMRDSIFAPLGMRATTIGTGAGIASSAVRYDSKHRPVPYYDFDHRGASAVYTTAHDLLRFGMFHLDTPPRDLGASWRPPLGASSIERMQRVATPGDSTSGYGLGWFIDDDLGFRRIRHTGGMPGVATALSLYPAQRVAIVVLSNQSSALPGRISAEIAALVLPASYATSLATRRAAPAPTPAEFSAPRELRGEWRGSVRTYEGTLPITLRVDSSEVRVRLGDRPALWTLLNDATFRNRLLAGRFLGVIPTADAGRVPHLVTMQVQLRGDTLRGWAAASATAETNDYSLSSYAELTRSAAGRLVRR